MRVFCRCFFMQTLVGLSSLFIIIDSCVFVWKSLCSALFSLSHRFFFVAFWSISTQSVKTVFAFAFKCSRIFFDLDLVGFIHSLILRKKQKIALKKLDHLKTSSFSARIYGHAVAQSAIFFPPDYCVHCSWINVVSRNFRSILRQWLKHFVWRSYLEARQ